MSRVIVCDEDPSVYVDTLSNYEIITTKTMKQCLKAFDLLDIKPDLLLSAQELTDGTGEDVARAINKIALTKVVIMTKGAPLEQLYHNELISEVVTEPIKGYNLAKMVARIIGKCVICKGAQPTPLAHRLICPFCDGKGHYTDQGFGYLQHHLCHCPVKADCEVCHKACHCVAH